MYIKTSEATLRIGVSLVTTKRVINDGRLIGEKMGSRWQVLEQSVFDFLGKDKAEVDKSEEEVNKNYVDFSVSTVQNPLEPIPNSLDTVNSGGVSSAVVSVGDDTIDISRVPARQVVKLFRSIHSWMMSLVACFVLFN